MKNPAAAEIMASLECSEMFEQALIFSNKLQGLLPDEQARLCPTLLGIRARRAEKRRRLKCLCRTREELDEAGLTITRCLARERELLSQHKLTEESPQQQARSCPELVNLRREKNAALAFLKTHN